MKSKSGSAAVSKNFNFKPEGGISPMMNIGGGTVSPNMHTPDPNTPLSKNIHATKSNAISKNFVEADKAARSANKQQGGQTHAVMRKSW